MWLASAMRTKWPRRNTEEGRPEGRDTKKSSMSTCMTVCSGDDGMGFNKGKNLIQIAHKWAGRPRRMNNLTPDVLTCMIWWEKRAEPPPYVLAAFQYQVNQGVVWMNKWFFLEPKTLHLQNYFQTYELILLKSVLMRWQICLRPIAWVYSYEFLEIMVKFIISYKSKNNLC